MSVLFIDMEPRGGVSYVIRSQARVWSVLRAPGDVIPHCVAPVVASPIAALHVVLWHVDAMDLGSVILGSLHTAITGLQSRRSLHGWLSRF